MSFVNKKETGRPVTILDEGVALTTNVGSLDFTGAGVTTTNIGTSVTATIPSNIVGPSSLTQGSVLFVGAGNVVAQDNANFFWDDSTNRLGIGTTTPAAPLDILLPSSSGSFVPVQKYTVQDISTGRQDVITFSGGATSSRGMQVTVQELTSGGSDSGFGISGFRFFLNEVRMFHEGAHYLSFWTNNLERTRILSTGEMGLGITTPTAKLHIKQVVATSGTAKSLIVDNFNHTAQTASTEINNVAFNTYTRTWAAGSITTQRENVFFAPTYAFASASTITTSATLAISGAPISGTNATITTPLALWVQGGTSLFAGAVTVSSSTPVLTLKDSANSGAQNYIPRIDFVTSTDVIRARIDVNVSNTGGLSISNNSGSPNGNIFLRTGSVNRVVVSSGGLIGIGIDSPTAQFHVVPALFSANSAGTAILLTGASHLALTASTEFPDVNLNLNRTVQWATGDITTQRAVLFQAPTYGFVGSSTVTVAANVAITGSPLQGTNAILTNTVGLMVGNPLTTVTSSVAGSSFQAIIVPEGITNGVTTVAGRVGLLITSAQPLTLGNQTATLTDFFGIKVESQSLSSTTNTRTITNAASLYIEGAPSNNSNVAFTNGPYSVWVDDGLSRFDGNGTRVFELPADATGNATAATGRVPILVGGATKYLRYYDD